MKQPWMKYYPSDWRADPSLRICSLGARGLWIEMLCLMHDAEPAGSLIIGGMNGKPPTMAQLAALVSAPPKQVQTFFDELEAANVFSRDPDGTIFSRRMRRDFDKAERDKANGKTYGKLGGHPNIRRGTVDKEDRVRRFKRSDSPVKARRIFDRSAGHCHWCGCALDHDHYHIDHVIAICDGGTNDENNLVASCPPCNGERALEFRPTTTSNRHE